MFQLSSKTLIYWCSVTLWVIKINNKKERIILKSLEYWGFKEFFSKHKSLSSIWGQHIEETQTMSFLIKKTDKLSQSCILGSIKHIFISPKLPTLIVKENKSVQQICVDRSNETFRRLNACEIKLKKNSFLFFVCRPVRTGNNHL